MAFSRQVASFIEAGISVLEALEIVGEETASEVMRVRIAEMRAAIERGSSFADAVDAHPDVFPAYYRAMVRSAEFTGTLGRRAAASSACTSSATSPHARQVKSALTYPVLVLIVATAAMIVMAVFVLPKFSGMYRSLGADLPLPTRMLLGVTDFLTGSWPLILATRSPSRSLLSWAVIGGTHGKSPPRPVRRCTCPSSASCSTSSPSSGSAVCWPRWRRPVCPLPDAIEMSAASTNNTDLRDQAGGRSRHPRPRWRAVGPDRRVGHLPHRRPADDQGR